MDVSNDSPFTGLFKAGETVSGLIRMGSAKDFPGLVPGIGLKMLRTGKMSANLVALHKLDALPDGQPIIGSNNSIKPLMEQSIVHSID